MIDLSDGTLWTKVFEQQYIAQPIPDKPGKFQPIPLILFPNTFDVHVVAISCVVPNSKPTWSYGGKVYQTIRATNDSDIGYFNLSKNYNLRINEATLVQFEEYSIYFRILYLAPEWFSEIFLSAWVYTGTPPTNTIEERLENVEIQLDRIEYKIDSINSNSSTGILGDTGMGI